MKKHIIIAFAMLACTGLKGWAQADNQVTGKVVDLQGNPVAGALVTVENNPLLQATTDSNGLFEISAEKNDALRVRTGNDDTKLVTVSGDKKIMTITMDLASQKVEYGFGLNQTRAESTGAASTVYADQIDNRSAMNIGNSLFGNVTGLTTMQNTGSI